MLLSNHDVDIMKGLKLTANMGASIDEACEEPWFQAEVQVATQYWKLTTFLAFSEIWSLLMYTMTFPCMLSGLQASDEAVSKISADNMRNLVAGVVKAESMVRDDPTGHRLLGELLKVAAYTTEAFAREEMAVVHSAGYNPASQELKDTCFLMEGGSSTTADCMERCFASLYEVNRSAYGNRRMEAFSKWFYAAASPYTESGGMPSPQTTKDDYIATSQYLGGTESATHNAFNVDSPHGLI